MNDSFYILELFSGHGSVSSIMGRIIGCQVETLDMDPRSGASMCVNILDWGQEHADDLRERHGTRRPIIFASPPCEHYSRARTTSPRDLTLADKRVAMVERIARELDACAVIMENPVGLLAGRDVARFLGHIYTVDYCQYGALYRKPTHLWSSVGLPPVFAPRECPLDGRCQAMVRDVAAGRWVHVDRVAGNAYEDKIRIPDQLVVCFTRGLLPHLIEWATMRSRDGEYEVEEIIDAREDDAGTREVLIRWKGYAIPGWTPFENLYQPITGYDFASTAVRGRVLAWGA